MNPANLTSSTTSLGHLTLDKLRNNADTSPGLQKQRAALELVEILNSLPQDPQIRLAPQATIVGGYCLNPNAVNADIDVEVANMSWEHLQKSMLTIKDRFQYFRRTKANAAGIIIQDKGVIPQDGDIGGNVFVCIWLTLKGGYKANISIPMKTTPETTRYDMNSVSYEPTLSYKEASARRTVAHKAIGYDITSGRFIDPHGGLDSLRKQELKIINAPSVLNDPVAFYACATEMLAFKLAPDSSSLAIMRQAANTPISTSETAKVSMPRLAVAIASLFNNSKIKPSTAIDNLNRLGALKRDVPALDQFIEQCRIADLRSLVGPGGFYEQCDVAWHNANFELTWPEQQKLSLVLGIIDAEFRLATGIDKSSGLIEGCIHPDSIGGADLLAATQACSQNSLKLIQNPNLGRLKMPKARYMG